MNKLFSSAKYVADHSDLVIINHEEIDNYVENFKPTEIDHWMKACPFEYHPLDNIEDELTRWFVEDALAFCFWGLPTKWTIDYQSQKIDGWWALLATFQKALEENIHLYDAEFLSKITSAELAQVLRGSPAIPLFEQRLDALNQIGVKLSSDYGGKIINFLSSSPRDAVELTVALADNFPIYNDVSKYKGRKIYFYKKAQLFVHDLVTGFGTYSFAKISGMSNLTGEADYKIPALLRHFNILKYSPELAEMVDNKVFLLEGSSCEVEIRANMLYACQLICEKLEKRGITIDPPTLDGILWVTSQTIKTNKPYHLTLTTNY